MPILALQRPDFVLNHGQQMAKAQLPLASGNLFKDVVLQRERTMALAGSTEVAGAERFTYRSLINPLFTAYWITSASIIMKSPIRQC